MTLFSSTHRSRRLLFLRRLLSFFSFFRNRSETCSHEQRQRNVRVARSHLTGSRAETPPRNRFVLMTLSSGILRVTRGREIFRSETFPTRSFIPFISRRRPTQEVSTRRRLSLRRRSSRFSVQRRANFPSKMTRRDLRTVCT